jgi:hypothetical protein
MRYIFVFSIVALIQLNASIAVGQAGDAAGSTVSREELIKSALASDWGEITAMEASARDGAGVFVGYSSGSVLNCRGDNQCRAFTGTPASALTGAVRTLAVSRRGEQEIVWVGYPHGVVYQCSNFNCREFRPE